MNIRPLIRAQSGLTVIEVVITLLLTSICAQLIFKSTYGFTQQLFLVSEVNDLEIKSQQLAYWLRQSLGRAGQYNVFDNNNKLVTNRESEQSFITSYPVAFTGIFKHKVNLGSGDGATDKIVINYLAQKGCNGQKYFYDNDELFHVVDEIYLDNGELRCRSYDGRYLTGMGVNKSSYRSVGLIQGVERMQAKYLVRHDTVFSFVDANELDSEQLVRAVKVELWLKDIAAKPLQVSQTYQSWLTSGDSFNSAYRYKRLLLVIPLSGYSNDI